MTKPAELYGRIVFSSAVHHMACWRVYRWCADNNYLDKMFQSESVAQLDLPQQISLAIIARVDTEMKLTNARPLIGIAQVEHLVSSGFQAGIEAVKRVYGDVASGGGMFVDQVE